MPPLRRLYLIDTDHLSLWERGGVEGENLRFRLRALAPDDYGTTIVNYEEQTRGRLAQVAAAKTPETEVEAYSRVLTRNAKDFGKIPSLLFEDWTFSKRIHDSDILVSGVSGSSRRVAASIEGLTL